MSKLNEFIDSDNAIVYTWNARTALVQIERWICVLVPLGGETGVTLDAERRATVSTILDTRPDACHSVRLGELALWLSRQWVRDLQLVLGTVYDRAAIRAASQWLFGHRLSADAVVVVESVPCVARCGTSAHALRMSCGDWMGLVMEYDGWPHGDDPLFPAIEETAS